MASQASTHDIANHRQSDAIALRESLCKEFPEIDSVCSMRYLSDVLSVPKRTFEYARDQKIRKSLLWRREFDVDHMCRRFGYDMCAGVIELAPTSGTSDCNSEFICSPGLLELCASRALRIMPDRDHDGRIVVLAETHLLNWHACGVEAGLRYHVLVIEAALSMIRSSNGRTPESMVLLVDVSAPKLSSPPPMAALQGMASLMQSAYPDRIHRIVVGPANFMVRGLYHIVKGFISENTRHKINLVGSRPEALMKFAVSSKVAKPKVVFQTGENSSIHMRAQDDSEASTVASDGDPLDNENQCRRGRSVDNANNTVAADNLNKAPATETQEILGTQAPQYRPPRDGYLKIAKHTDTAEEVVSFSAKDLARTSAKAAEKPSFFMLDCCCQRANEPECFTESNTSHKQSL